jgi:hypothetical protein
MTDPRPTASLYNFLKAIGTCRRMLFRHTWMRVAVDGGTSDDPHRWKRFYPAAPHQEKDL